MSSPSKDGQPILYLDLEAKPTTEKIYDNSADTANAVTMVNNMQVSDSSYP